MIELLWVRKGIYYYASGFRYVESERIIKNKERGSLSTDEVRYERMWENY